MREIKFRGKSKVNREWIHGGILQRRGYTAICVYSDYHQWHEFIEVDPKTVGQYAGFKDDTDESVEVFEGDIVQIDYYGEGHTCEVQYHGSGFLLAADSLPDGYIWAQEMVLSDGELAWAEYVTVVGNVHDERLLAPKEGADKRG